MAESLQLLSRDRETELELAREARELQARQQAWAALADEYHDEIRAAATARGRKNIASDLGWDLSTISNQLSCEQGRGSPSPKLILYLRKHHPPLAAWERDHAQVLVGDGELLDEIERDLLPELGKRDAEKLREKLRRRRSAR